MHLFESGAKRQHVVSSHRVDQPGLGGGAHHTDGEDRKYHEGNEHFHHPPGKPIVCDS